MAKVVLVTDSTSYLPVHLLQSYGIIVAPQVLIWGNETYRDGVDITPQDFYSRLSKATTMPSTSQVLPIDFQQIFKKILDHGDQVLAILISEKLSGTIASAIHAKKMFPGAPIEIVDSTSTSMALGFQVLATARLAEQGANLEDCKSYATQISQNIGVVFAVDTLDFLHRGGRIGGAQHLVGTVLKMKPILEVVDGRVEAIERVRTRSKSLSRLVELIEDRVKGRYPVRLATLHANAPEIAQELLATASKKLSAVESIFSEVSPVIGTHAGPGTVGLAFMAGIE